jgi:phage baseplate assembly protein gpV
LSAMYGVYIGIVKDLNDPLGEGRIRLQLPQISEELTGWAPIARPMAGKERGHFFMPELEDEALVAFDNGAFDHPYVVGFLHNGVDLPPDDDIDNSVRRLKTVSGHILEFDDRAGKERILLKTQGGHFLEMKDNEKTIEIKTSGGQQILMEDQLPKITIKTVGGASVTMSDAPSQVEAKTAGGVSILASDAGGVTINAPAGSLNVTCLSATLNCSAACTINAATMTLNAAALSVSSGIATFAGVVQCSALITNAVVSTSYTPGVGNIF